ncbi:hypothetical protein JCM1840_000524 [Sporobolomyces johnsonii]
MIRTTDMPAHAGTGPLSSAARSPFPPSSAAATDSPTLDTFRFLETATPDLTLSLDGFSEHDPADFSLDAAEGQTSSSEASEDGREAYPESPWTTPEGAQDPFEGGEHGQDEEKGDEGAEDPGTTGFLEVSHGAGGGAGDRSGNTDPDSFMDPVMVEEEARLAQAAQPVEEQLPDPTPFTSTPPRPALTQLVPPPSFNTTPSPPKHDIAGRLLPSAPPPMDPFAFALSQRQEQPRSPKRRLGSFTRPFGRAPADVTMRSSSTTGYLDTSLNLTASTSGGLQHEAQPPSPARPSRLGPLPIATLSRPQTAPERTPQSLLRPHSPISSSSPTLPTSSPTSPLSPASIDLPSLPPPSHSPDLDNEHRPLPPVRTRSADHLPIQVPTTSPAPAPSAPSPRSIINRTPSGFYRLPVSPFSDVAFPLPPPSSAGSSIRPLLPFAHHQHTSSYDSSERAASSLAFSLPSPPPWGPAPSVPSFVSVFIEPPHSPTSPAISIPIYPPGASSSARRTHPNLQSIDSFVDSPPQKRTYNLRQRFFGASGAEPAARERTATNESTLVGGASGHSGEPLIDAAALDGKERRRVEREREREKLEATKRRTQEWLSGVAGVGVGAEKDVDAATVATVATAGSRGTKVTWAAAATGWSLRGGSPGKGDRSGRRGGSHRRGGSLAGGGSGKGKALLRSKRFRLLVAALLLVIVLVIGLGAGLSRKGSGAATVGACSCENGGTATVNNGVCLCSCKGDWGGTSCHLNATCANPAGNGHLVAQGLLDVAGNAASLWQPSLNTSRLAYVVDHYVFPSSSTAASCKFQLALVTLPNLPFSSFPSRLQWIESALLYTLALTESNSTANQFLTFASGLDYTKYGNSPATKPNSNYQIIAGGFTWDLAAMQRSVQNVTWESAASPSSEAQSVMGAAPEALAALERITAYAVASSAQRSTALAHYWNDTLGLSAADLATFRSVVQSAEIVIPLDATETISGTSMMSLAAEQTNQSSFPPAIGCLPNLSDDDVQRVNDVEANVFGLADVTSSQALNGTCLDRPLYGLLNLLSLRLPFSSSDSRSSLPQQALVISTEDSSRVSVHAGELLAAGAIASATTSPTAPATLERFGLLSNLDHVLLDYLTLLDTATAQLLIAYVLSSPSGPPAATSALSQATNSLASLPMLEVQLWGGLRYSEISLVRSGLSSSDGSALFFGSDDGDSFRTWAISGTTTTTTTSSGNAGVGEIEWTLDAQEAEVAPDTSVAGSTAFQKVWASAATAGTASSVWSALGKAGLLTGA